MKSLPTTIKTENPYEIAIHSTQVREMKVSEVKNSLAEIISKAYFDAGQVMPGYDVQNQKQNFNLLVQSMQQELSLYFRFIKIEEVRMAFANGVRKQYGEYFGLNVGTFHQWLKAFQKDEKRLEAIKQNKAAQESRHEPEIDKVAAEAEYREVIKRQFANYKTTGHLVCSFPNLLYNRFEKKGVINLTLAEKKEIYEAANQRILKVKRLERLNPKSIIHLRELNAYIEAATVGGLNSIQQEFIKAEARKIAIERYYDTISELIF